MIIEQNSADYLKVKNKDDEISRFSSKIEMLNKWVIDEYKDFYVRVQWITAGAISLSVPLLVNQKINLRHVLSVHNLQITNLSFLSLSWVALVLSFTLALYRNKLHPEYMHNTHLADWQKLHEEKLEIIVSILKDQNTDECREFLDKKSQVSKIVLGSIFWSKLLWKLTQSLGIVSQILMILGILSFVVFGLTTLSS